MADPFDFGDPPPPRRPRRASFPWGVFYAVFAANVASALALGFLWVVARVLTPR